MEITQDLSTQSKWNLPTLLAFRFTFVFFTFNIIPDLFYYLSSFSGQDNLFDFYSEWIDQLCVWTGKNILAIKYDIRIGPNGSGDTTADYIFQFIAIIISIFFTVLWTLIEHKKDNYQKLLVYFRTFIRYYITLTMFSYGFSKAFTLQFSELSNFDLIQTFGEQSPMGLMWNFMEYSDTYTRFSGYAEIIAGALLLFRKTTILGAIMTIGVMFNVFMMNMSYDIPVKLYSGLLTLMGIFLLVPDFKRLINFFILNNTVNPKRLPSYSNKNKHRKALAITKTLFIIFILYFNISDGLEGQEEWGKKAPKPALYGIYEVEEFVKNNDTLPPLANDSIRWKRLVIDKWYSGIQTMDEKITGFKEETDTITKTISLTSYGDSTDIKKFSFKQKDSLFYFETIHHGDTLIIAAKKKLREDFLLINRGFHWINEFPYNR
ncbi:hypothetical protein M0D21_06515 [Aquimarina sp. D1M17]|uniref:hypothetical protein n=1 Tax=Aquimarina acroporae TaxID=2937283 RepID=UPI0020C1819F|nr:hypothetical protein [Aquimarina acroporae]MCK8521210.1 hypothetical protein [Aquimarina acroporae]